MSEETRERRAQSPHMLAFRAERVAMLPIRERIGRLHSQAALIAARAYSSKTVDPEGIKAAYQFVRDEIERTQSDIDHVVNGTAGGPADDCRRALRMLASRLP